MEEMYLIWSNQHCEWWKSNNGGYTKKIETAGIYTRTEATDICKKENVVDSWLGNDMPDALPIRLNDLPDEAIALVSKLKNPKDTFYPMKFTKHQWIQFFEFLDDLQKSDDINMYNAHHNLEKEFTDFPGFSVEILFVWMETYDSNRSPEERAEEHVKSLEA